MMIYRKPPAKRCPKCKDTQWMRLKGIHDKDTYHESRLVYYCPVCETIADLPVDYDPMKLEERPRL